MLFGLVEVTSSVLHRGEVKCRAASSDGEEQRIVGGRVGGREQRRPGKGIGIRGRKRERQNIDKVAGWREIKEANERNKKWDLNDQCSGVLWHQ